MANSKLYIFNLGIYFQISYINGQFMKQLGNIFIQNLYQFKTRMLNMNAKYNGGKYLLLTKNNPLGSSVVGTC